MSYVEALKKYDDVYLNAVSQLYGSGRAVLQEYFMLRRAGPESASRLLAAEQVIQNSLPLALREMWLFGGFDLQCNSSRCLEFMSISRCHELARTPGNWASIGDVLQGVSAAEFSQTNWPSDLSSLWTDYFICGQSQLSDFDFEFLVFSRDGHLGLVRYHHEWWHHNWGAWRAEFEGLVAGRMRPVDVGAYFADQVAVRTERLHRWLSTPLESA